MRDLLIEKIKSIEDDQFDEKDDSLSKFVLIWARLMYTIERTMINKEIKDSLKRMINDIQKFEISSSKNEMFKNKIIEINYVLFELVDTMFENRYKWND